MGAKSSCLTLTLNVPHTPLGRSENRGVGGLITIMVALRRFLFLVLLICKILGRRKAGD